MVNYFMSPYNALQKFSYFLSFFFCTSSANVNVFYWDFYVIDQYKVLVSYDLTPLSKIHGNHRCSELMERWSLIQELNLETGA